jgi:uncharacterized protein YbjT (DUF2867 family)
MMYLITGATGHIGSKVVERLIRSGQRPRVFVREGQKARSRFGDDVEVFVGDLDHPESLKPALAGVGSLFLINVGPEIARRDETAAKLAKAAGVKHLVKLSALSAVQALAIGAWHAQGEAAIRASGPPFTFLRPAGFMSNTLEWAASIRAEGVVRACTGEGRVAYIHPDDVAAVATKVLLTEQHKGESLHITGPQAMSYSEMTAAIGAAIGKVLRFDCISADEAQKRLVARGMQVTEAEALVSLWCAIREGYLTSVTDQVNQILGEKPITFQHWAEQNAAAFWE